MADGDSPPVFLETLYPVSKAVADCGATSFHEKRGTFVFAAQEAGSRAVHYTRRGLTHLVLHLNTRRAPSVRLFKSHAYAVAHGQRKYTSGACFRRFARREWDQFVRAHGASFEGGLVEH